ncbi:LacI family DNA-binding transcriptional regulator [Thermotoga sp. KOL6]|uniref:LacI family DNA-binding transcriptional regulator n=1 Tax=Thermotoga sp. KOL6 TaxID=126741 RepID=UPI000C77B413|nr:LacI family DNA-binding transcriptional regulator [Thermotoga sp. KOL6]PLV58283.1 hypothetical protein AS005_07890 [Thermotoga sp. KOL6]
MATLKDIAKLANVSVATVSNVLNGKGRVSEAKRKEILEIAKKLNYTPNFHARAMALKKRLITIGLIVPDITNPFFAKLTRGVEKVCGEDVFVILIDSFRDLSREEKLIRKARFLGVDGLIIGNSRVDDDLVREVSTYLPVVVFDKEYEYENVISIVLDNYYGAYLATKHLLENGCNNVIHLGGTPELYVSIERKKGYSAAMIEKNLKPMVFETGYNEDQGYEMMKRILASKIKVDGVFCMNDLVALGALKAIREERLMIPQDIQIVGFDDDKELCEVVSPSLSSIHQPVEEMGETAARLLIELIQGKVKIRRYVFSPHLVIRESSSRRLTRK